MAHRRARKPSAPRTGRIVQWLLNPKVVGTVLVVTSVLTLLSLMSTRGRLTALWIDLLQRGLGAGVWGFPLVTGFLGYWIVIRDMEHMPRMSWHRPAGLVALYLCFVIAIALAPVTPFLEAALLLSPTPHSAGGWIGYLFGTQLQLQLGELGAWFVLTVLTGASLYMIAPGLSRRGLARLLRGLRWVWARMGEVQEKERTPKPWPETTLYRVWQRLKEVRRVAWWVARVYRRWEQAYFDWLRRMREPRPAPVETVAIASPAVQTAVRPPAPEPVPPTAPAAAPAPEAGAWQLPRLSDILDARERELESDDQIRRCGALLQETLELFGVPSTFEGAYKGPAVTQYLIKPGFIERQDSKGTVRHTKVKVSKITSLSNDLALAVAAQSVRIEAPIPGTSYVGIEIPNTRSNSVSLRELMQSAQFMQMEAQLPLALGEDVKGQPIVADLSRMPHMLIAGATGTGKSVCINAIITTLLLTHTPDTLRFLMIDPKMVELSEYNQIPHLLKNVVIEVDQAQEVLEWCVREMEHRYRLLNQSKSRDIARYNAHRQGQGEAVMPYIVVIIDEMSDLMMSAPQEVERAVCRLAQMARAVGIHLIIATQRPSVDVITGLIKANFPARIAFAVSSQTDSRVIIDMPGAERLLGQGDMLFAAPDAKRSGRVQGTWVSDPEIQRIVEYWRVSNLRREEALSAREASATAPSATETEPAARGWESDLSAPARDNSSFVASDAGQPDAAAPSHAFERIEDPPEALPVHSEPEATPRSESQDDPVDGAWQVPDPSEEPSPESEAGLLMRTVRLAENGSALSLSLVQRKLRVGRRKALALLDRLLMDGALGEDQLDPQTRRDVGAFRALRDPGRNAQI